MNDIETVDISALLSDDNLGEALALAVSYVKAKPTDTAARLQLAELCVLRGDLEKADTHLKLAQRQNDQEAVQLGIFRQHLRGLDARLRWWTEGALPEFPKGPTDCDRHALALNVALAANDLESAMAAATKLEEARVAQPVLWDDKKAADFRDLDDRLPHAFEIITQGGNYIWLDMNLVTQVAFKPVVRPIDLICRHARISMRDGAEGDVLIPAVYPDPKTHSERLGRCTEFESICDGVTIARGQRSYLVGEDVGAILDAHTLKLMG